MGILTKDYRKTKEYKRIRESYGNDSVEKDLFEYKMERISGTNKEKRELLKTWNDALDFVPGKYTGRAVSRLLYEVNWGDGASTLNAELKEHFTAWKRDMNIIPEKLTEKAFSLVFNYSFLNGKGEFEGKFGPAFSDKRLVDYLSGKDVDEEKFSDALMFFRKTKGVIKDEFITSLLEDDASLSRFVEYSIPVENNTISHFSRDYGEFVDNIKLIKDYSEKGKDLLPLAREVGKREKLASLKDTMKHMETSVGDSSAFFGNIVNGSLPPGINSLEGYDSAFCDIIEDKEILERVPLLRNATLELFSLARSLVKTTPALYGTVLKEVLKKEKSRAKIDDINDAVDSSKELGLVEYLSTLEPARSYRLLEEIAAMGDMVPSAGAIKSTLNPPLYPKLVNGVDVVKLEYYAELAGKDVKLRSLEAYDGMKKEAEYLRKALSDKEDAGLRKRLDNIEKMLSDPENSKRVSERLQREVEEKKKEYKFDAVFALIRDSHNEYLREILNEDPAGIALTPDLSNAIKFYAACKKEKVNVDAARKIVYNAVKGNSRWILEEEKNKEFLEKAKQKGINTVTWVDGKETEYEIGGEKIRIHTENDPLRVLQMGNSMENSCLSVTGQNREKTPANAVDINRRIVYAEDDNGKLLARAVIGLSNDANLVQGGFYKNVSIDDKKASEIKGKIKEFIFEFSRECNAPALPWGSSRTVENLVSEEAYDSITYDV